MAEVPFDQVEALEALISDEFGEFGEPLEITQAMVDAFADLTDDHQWIHVDVDRARAESPFGSTIAHGFLILALLPRLRRSVVEPQVVGHGSALNFGAESLKFTEPVPVGAKVAVRTRLVGAAERKGSTLVTTEIVMHVEGNERPSLVYRMQVLYRP